MELGIIFQIAVLVLSVVLHEVAHGALANAFGDPTAKLQGRLTLNPIKHIDPFGSVVLPGILALTNAPFLFGWAKPVPYNPYNFRKGGRFSEALVAGAGPFVNFAIAILFGLLLRFGIIPDGASSLAVFIVVINLVLGFFNSMPIPPLDGSKMIEPLVPSSMRIKYAKFRLYMEANPLFSFGALIFFILAFSSEFAKFINIVFAFLVGV